MSSSSITNIPHFITAKTAKGLRKLMLKNNIQHGLIFNYFQIHQDNKGTWFAWFQLDAVDAFEEELKEMKANGKSNGN